MIARFRRNDRRHPLVAARREAIIDRVLHLVAITAAMVGSFILLRSLAVAHRPELEMPIGLYILGLLSMLICSAADNASEHPSWRPVLRRLDYAAIFLLIAATYSPFLVGATGTRIVGIAYVTRCDAVCGRATCASRLEEMDRA
jgi:hemolysin III